MSKGFSGNGKNRERQGGKSRKTIKNARGLADVIGGKRKDAPSGGPRRDSSISAPRGKGPLSNKLQYITNFSPPGGESRGQSEARRPAEARPTEPRRQVEAKKPVSTRPSAPAPKADGWPQARMQKKAPEPARRGKAPAAGAKIVEGFVKRHPDGFGFLIPDDRQTPDVYISRQSMTGVMTNDRVEVQIYQPRSFSKGKEDRISGEVIRVLSRANKRVVGKYLPVDAKYGVILDENRGWGADLRIAANDSLNAKEGEVVAVEVTQYPNHDREFTGKVVGLLGDVGDPLNDVIRVVHEASIPNEFSAAAIADAEHFGGVVAAAEKQGREDLTKLNLITIDGATARDFDDAIYTERAGNGFRLVVAIADVSHYVKPGSVLDNEAYERGTSTYFPNFVVPMLPEALSNELCSLVPRVARLAFACEMRISLDGEVQSYRFFEAVIESKARVTYGEAQEVLDLHAAGTGGKVASKLKSVEENILQSADLAKILMARRFREGSLDLEIPETQVVVDASGETSDIIRSQRLFAHRLIEELMLVTNICTARFLDNAGVPGIYRVHGEPDADAIRSLQRYLWNLGGSKSVMGGGLAKKLTDALAAMADRPEAQILNILTLRTMQQAQYSDHNIGHFGLGFSHYSHFTSPIRRYPDLIAHRIIKSQIYPKYASMQMAEAEIASATTWLSACEQRSAKAERKVISIKKARFIKRFVGQEFPGIISSVTRFGVFVLLRQYDVDGLVKVEGLGDDRFEFDDQNLRLIGARSGLQYAIGDALHVLVRSADTETGKVDFALAAESAERSQAATAGSGRREKIKRAKEHSRGKSEGDQSTQRGKKDQLGPQKRGKTKNNRRRVRKERVSKRR